MKNEQIQQAAIIKKTSDFADKWYKENNPFFPFEMRWDYAMAFSLLKAYALSQPQPAIDFGDKEQVIKLIKGRIEDEYRKHSTGLDWAEIAARKLYTQWSEFYNGHEKIDIEHIVLQYLQLWEYEFSGDSVNGYPFYSKITNENEINLQAVLEDFADDLLNLQPKEEKSDWISVEVPPKEDQYVLLYGRGGRQITAIFKRGKFMCYDLFSENLEEADYIDYWQPLPNPPKGF